MSNLERVMNAPEQALSSSQATKADFNRYVFDNPADHIASEKLKETLYKAAAIGLMLLMGTGIVIGTIALMHLAPISVPFFLIFAGGCYKVFHSKVFTPLKQSGELAGADARMYEGMVKEVNKVEQAYTDYNSYSTMLRGLGISSANIPVGELSEAAGEPYLKPLAKLIGRVKYWDTVEKETLTQIQKVNEQIAQIEITPTSEPKMKAEKTRLRIQKQQLEELKFLPAKVAGAYALHVLSNVRDKRDFDVFGTCTPAPYLNHLEYMADRVPQPYYIFPQNASTPSLSTKQMFDASQLELSKRIFGDSNAFA